MKTNFMSPVLLGLLMVSAATVSAAPKISLKGLNKDKLITTSSQIEGLVSQGDKTVSVMDQSGLLSVHQRFGKATADQAFPLHGVSSTVGESRSYYELIDIDGKSYRASWSKAAQKIDGKYENHNFKATKLPWDHRADVVNYDGKMIHQISPQDAQSKKNAVVFSLSSREAGKATKVQKQVLFHLDSSYPADSQILDFTANNDMSQVVVRLLDSNNKVTEYTFKVGEKDAATGYNKLQRVALQKASLSDFYAGDIVTRQAVNSGSTVKGLSVLR